MYTGYGRLDRSPKNVYMFVVKEQELSNIKT